MNKQLLKRSPYGVVSLTLGIISIVMAIFWFISIPTSVLAIIFGNKGRKIYGSNTSKAGMITGIVGATICGIYLSFYLVIFIVSHF